MGKGKEVLQGSFKQYKIIEEISRGGMGVVYRAQHLQTMKFFALKLLLDVTAQQSRKRFIREAKALSLVDHPNVISIVEYGDYQGTLYIVMDLIEGQDLASLVEESLREAGSALSPDWAITIFRGIVEGLQACHFQGLYHRDIKPENIIIDSQTQKPILIDFGLVKKDKNSGRFDSLSLTKSSDIIGTPRYMSPEQLDSNEFGDIGKHTDIWSFGATMFYCLTGKHPYEEDTLIGLYTKMLVGEAPRIKSINKTVPLWLSDLCSACMVKKPQQRASLESLLDTFKEQGRNKASNSRINYRWISAASVTIAIILLAFFLLRPTQAVITIFQPQSGQEVYCTTIVIQGHVSGQHSEIEVDGVPTKVNSNGQFQAVIDRDIGKQKLELVFNCGGEKSMTIIQEINVTDNRRLLLKLGKLAVPTLIDSLNHRSEKVRISATETLGNLGSEALTAAPFLITALSDKDKNVRVNAAAALGKIGPEAIPALIEALRNRSETVRCYAAEILNATISENNKAVPALIKALDDPAKNVQICAALTLVNMQRDAIPLLIEALNSPSRNVRGYASGTLSKMGELSIPYLIEGLSNPIKNVRGYSARALGNMGSKAIDAVPALRKLLGKQGEDRVIKNCAKMALEEITGKN